MANWQFEAPDGRIIILSDITYYLKKLEPRKSYVLVMKNPPEVYETWR
jgi:hypothetical protein